MIKLDYSLNNELPAEEKALVFPSIKAFQIGEGSEGKHLSKTVKEFAERINYNSFPEIMKWFILEENRHSQTLKKYLDVYGIESVQKLWIDNVFRFLRKLMGLECEVIVLVTAEMIALSYYDALSDATNSKLLKDICAQMLNDELKHVVLQSDTLNRISSDRNEIINNISRIIRKAIMSITSSVVWLKYKKVFEKGGYTKKLFKENCRFYLNESIAIEITGRFL
ncbi:MAG: hypothetical protein K2G56_01890 [Eubacterium sp.]|nr:hypothetical protein [Eubacterium sp.]